MSGRQIVVVVSRRVTKEKARGGEHEVFHERGRGEETQSSSNERGLKGKERKEKADEQKERRDYKGDGHTWCLRGRPRG